MRELREHGEGGGSVLRRVRLRRLPDGRAFAIAALASGDSPSGIEAIHTAGSLSYEHFAASADEKERTHTG
ncbi:MAG: hypothetical protein M3494_12175 [Actinomycetota bacterium]|nr:hypothetical protein [Actinomycetota bacterium]